MAEKEYIEREAFLEQKREQYCKSCVHDKGDIGFCDKCGYTYMLRKYGLPPTEYEAKPKPQTNADRIRSMTDEELAEAICRLELLLAKQGHRGFHAWLDWLKEEVDTNDS